MEVHGDVASTLDLCAAYDVLTPRQNVNPKPPPVVPPIEVLKTLPLAFYNDDIKTLSDWCNTIISAEVEKCYGSFISWTSSILSDACLDELQLKTFATCAVPIAAIIEALGYRPKMRLNKKMDFINADHAQYALFDQHVQQTTVRRS